MILGLHRTLSPRPDGGARRLQRGRPEGIGPKRPVLDEAAQRRQDETVARLDLAVRINDLKGKT